MSVKTIIEEWTFDSIQQTSRQSGWKEGKEGKRERRGEGKERKKICKNPGGD